MAFDGATVACITHELNTKLIGGRLAKIAQPESDELLITVKTKEKAYLLTLSASPSLPILCISEESKVNPPTAPNFCMLLRKHIGNGKITAITQPGLERIVDFEIEHFDEMGDLKHSHLIIELMGKYSNIIFCNDSNVIIDSIKRIPSSVSSVREVLPGRTYFIPQTLNKFDPFCINEDTIVNQILSKTCDTAKALYQSLTGFSPFLAEELTFSSGIDSSLIAATLSLAEKQHLAHQAFLFIESIKEKHFTPMIVYQNNEPVDYAVFPITHLQNTTFQEFDSISALLLAFYAEKSNISRIRQKSADLRKLIQNNLERALKKYDLQNRQLKDTQKRDKFRIYGDLLSSYSHEIKTGLKECSVLNFYDNTMLKIPLDDSMTAMENAKRYYEKYNKLKRTYEALTQQLEETKMEIDYLSSVSTALELSTDAQNLNEIKSELVSSGYAKKTVVKGPKGKKPQKKQTLSEPYHYLSSDGYHIYVGKNNLQNDLLTFSFASNQDLWFHAKGIPGSHVIVKVTSDPIPDRLYEEAGALAAYYSSGRQNGKVEIDYIERKFIKKPPKANPGYVIYHTNYSLVAVASLEGLTQLE